MSTPLVALVGRPNVGKSTLFNRLVGGRKAIEGKIPGITRDRLYGRTSWLNRDFLVIDTGGLTFSGKEKMEIEVQRQAELAIEEAVVIVFLVDGRQGLNPLDEEIASLLRRQRKPVVLAVNKIESMGQNVAEFYRLGLSDPLPISAAHGLNTGDLLDKVISFFPSVTKETQQEDELIRIAIVGRPNVGKSSFINTLLGENRVIVTREPGTTRDAIDTLLEREGKKYILVDTAGIRRKSRVLENIEYYSVIRSLKAIDDTDIAVLLLEADTGATEQDQKIAGYILESGRALIVALNKWDLVKQQRREISEKIIDKTRNDLKFVSFAPLILTSIYEPRRLKNIFDLFQKVYKNYCTRVPTPLLNKLLSDAQGVNPLPTLRGRKGKIYYWTQTAAKPPTFVLFVNNTSLIHFSYLRYLENRLREAFSFEGTPVKLLVRSRRRKKG
ncbi:MAG: ribosome biogenesis GTPase Der [Firmicutes bacterium]|nr:ribosome biogenesis GTPase Der [Bacillota bacterium]